MKRKKKKPCQLVHHWAPGTSSSHLRPKGGNLGPCLSNLYHPCKESPTVPESPAFSQKSLVTSNHHSLRNGCWRIQLLWDLRRTSFLDGLSPIFFEDSTSFLWPEDLRYHLASRHREADPGWGEGEKERESPGNRPGGNQCFYNTVCACNLYC